MFMIIGDHRTKHQAHHGGEEELEIGEQRHHLSRLDLPMTNPTGNE